MGGFAGFGWIARVETNTDYLIIISTSQFIEILYFLHYLLFLHLRRKAAEGYGVET